MYNTLNVIPKYAKSQCQICFDECDIEITCLSGEHIVCVQCFQVYIKISLYERSRIGCVFTECRLPYKRSILRKALNPMQFNKYKELDDIQRTQRKIKQDPDYSPCPNCACYATNINTGLAKCKKCKKHWCITCQHGLMCKLCPPKTNKISNELDNINPTLREQVNLAIDRAIIRKCPNCTTSYYRIDGCNKIVCTVCGIFSCYLCNTIVYNYDHFKVNCALYTTNQIIDIIRIRIELEKIITLHYESRQYIISYVKKLGYDIVQPYNIVRNFNIERYFGCILLNALICLLMALMVKNYNMSVSNDILIPISSDIPYCLIFIAYTCIWALTCNIFNINTMLPFIFSGLITIACQLLHFTYYFWILIFIIISSTSIMSTNYMVQWINTHYIID